MEHLVGQLLNIVGMLCLIAVMLTIVGWFVIASLLYLLDVPKYEIRNKIEHWWLKRRLRRAVARCDREARRGGVSEKASADLEDADAALREWKPRDRSRVDW